MSNLGTYLSLTKAAKYVGGPAVFIGGIFCTGVIIGAGLVALIQNVVDSYDIYSSIPITPLTVDVNAQPVELQKQQLMLQVADCEAQLECLENCEA